MPTRYIIKTKVAKVSNKVKKDDPNSWFVLFEGSWEFILFGNEKPALEVGQAVRITIEGEDKCPQPSTNFKES